MTSRTRSSRLSASSWSPHRRSRRGSVRSSKGAPIVSPVASPTSSRREARRGKPYRSSQNESIRPRRVRRLLRTARGDRQALLLGREGPRDDRPRKLGRSDRARDHAPARARRRLAGDERRDPRRLASREGRSFTRSPRASSRRARRPAPAHRRGRPVGGRSEAPTSRARAHHALSRLPRLARRCVARDPLARVGVRSGVSLPASRRRAQATRLLRSVVRVRDQGRSRDDPRAKRPEPEAPPQRRDRRRREPRPLGALLASVDPRRDADGAGHPGLRGRRRRRVIGGAPHR